METQRQPDRLKVSVSDPTDDTTLGSRVICDDYCLVTAGHCHLASTRVYPNGTHVLVVKNAKPHP